MSLALYLSRVRSSEVLGDDARRTIRPVETIGNASTQTAITAMKIAKGASLTKNPKAGVSRPNPTANAPLTRDDARLFASSTLAVSMHMNHDQVNVPMESTLAMNRRSPGEDGPNGSFA